MSSSRLNARTTVRLQRTVYVTRQTKVSEKLPRGYGETLQDGRACHLPGRPIQTSTTAEENEMLVMRFSHY
jgi:hypothetical protein